MRPRSIGETGKGRPSMVSCTPLPSLAKARLGDRNAHVVTIGTPSPRAARCRASAMVAPPCMLQHVAPCNASWRQRLPARVLAAHCVRPLPGVKSAHALRLTGGLANDAPLRLTRTRHHGRFLGFGSIGVKTNLGEAGRLQPHGCNDCGKVAKPGLRYTRGELLFSIVNLLESPRLRGLQGVSIREKRAYGRETFTRHAK